MNRANKNRIIKLEGSVELSERHKSALVIYDHNADYELDLSKIEADVIIVLPDNGRGDFNGGVVVGSCVVCYI